jgi:hypothetical protein
MRSSRLFWGGALVVLGGLLLLRSLGIITWNIWIIFWPALLILAGVWVLLRPSMHQAAAETVTQEFPLESIQQAVVDINHGAGTLHIGAGAAAGKLMQGTFNGGVEARYEKIAGGGSLLISPPTNVVWGFPGGFDREGFRWDIRLTDAIPMDMHLRTGAGESKVDLSALRVQKLMLETGASSSIITLPSSAGLTQVEVHAGAASVVLKIPEGVAGHILMKSGLVGTKIDTAGFPFNGDVYETPNYDAAANKVQIRVEAGVGAIEIVSA